MDSQLTIVSVVICFLVGGILILHRMRVKRAWKALHQQELVLAQVFLMRFRLAMVVGASSAETFELVPQLEDCTDLPPDLRRRGREVMQQIRSLIDLAEGPLPTASAKELVRLFGKTPPNDDEIGKWVAVLSDIVG